jgi:propionyl-CoA carboxylase alpha chain
MILGRKTKTELKKIIAVNDNQRNKHEFKLPISDEITINGKQGEIKVKEDDKLGTYLVWKNKKIPVEVLSQNQNRYEILLDGVSYNFTIETPTSYKRRKFLDKNKAAKGTEALVAPMPGKIVEVLTEEGREVRAGEPLLILEAMKMQNELQAPSAGKVGKILVKGGQSVLKDDLLVEIKPDK